MTRLLTLAVLLLAATTAQASDYRDSCKRKAVGVSGSERSDIVSSCIRSQAATNTMPPMLARMSQCNREAGEMTGENRVRFVNTCLERHD